MPTKSRIRRTLDLGRLRDAIAGPGADPRTWAAIGRVEEAEDAVSYVEGTGWVADVIFTSGPLAQEGGVPCRVAVPFGGNGQTAQQPVAQGCEVLVLIPDGDPNVAPTIVGYLHNPADCAVPTSAAGDTVDEAYSRAHHVFVTPHGVTDQVGGDVLQQIAGDIDMRADGSIRSETPGTNRLLGLLVELADEGATQNYVKGLSFSAALATLLAVMAAESTAAAAAAVLLAPIPVLAPAAAAIAAWGVAATATATAITTTFLPRLVPGDLLSTRIKGE
jgi:hypothetical protein